MPKNRIETWKLAVLTGKSKEVINEWVAEGKIRPFSGPGIDGATSYRFFKSEVAGLLASKEIEN